MQRRNSSEQTLLSSLATSLLVVLLLSTIVLSIGIPVPHLALPPTAPGLVHIDNFNQVGFQGACHFPPSSSQVIPGIIVRKTFLSLRTALKNSTYRKRLLKLSNSATLTCKKIKKLANNSFIFFLVNAESQSILPEYSPLLSGTVLSLDKLPAPSLNLRVVPLTSSVRSVVVEVNSAQPRIDRKKPFNVFEESNGNYLKWIPAAGEYGICATGITKSGNKTEKSCVNLSVTH